MECGQYCERVWRLWNKYLTSLNNINAAAERLKAISRAYTLPCQIENVMANGWPCIDALYGSERTVISNEDAEVGFLERNRLQSFGSEVCRMRGDIGGLRNEFNMGSNSSSSKPSTAAWSLTVSVKAENVPTSPF